MFTATSFRELVSGRKSGPAASAMRGLLRVAESPYGWAMALRNRRYDTGKAEIVRVEVPVVSVGNLTMGGTGKTPMVEWVAKTLRRGGLRVSLVSRGYGAALGGTNDEALELELALPDVPHVQNPDRVAAAAIAIEDLATQLIVLDDGFQHRRLARDLEIVLLDATEPFGFEHVFPRGTLREPLSGLSRAQVVVLSRADMLVEAERAAIRNRAMQIAPGATWCEVVHRPQRLISSQGLRASLELLRDKRVAACSGIGNPAGFRHTLGSLGCDPVLWREFSDHHSYSREDVESLTTWAADADMVVCTRKDLVKLGIPLLGRVPLWALEVEMQFLAGEDRLVSILADLAHRALQSDALTFDSESCN